MQNALVESFNGRLRDECLNENLFGNLAEVRRIIETWRIDYNINRPHTSLNGQSPTEFAQRLRSTRPASLELRSAGLDRNPTSRKKQERILHLNGPDQGATSVQIGQWREGHLLLRVEGRAAPPRETWQP